MPISRFSPAKEQQVFVVYDSAAITAGDISEVLVAIKSLSGDRSSAMSAEGAVTLVFHGYDDDPRELEAIPEVREWFAKLRAELDGLIAHLCGLTEAEFAHILTTFPLVKEPVKVAALNAYRDVESGLVK